MTFGETLLLFVIGILVNDIAIFLLQNIYKNEIKFNIIELKNKLDVDLMERTTQYTSNYNKQVEILEIIHRKYCLMKELLKVVSMPYPIIKDQPGIESLAPHVSDVVDDFIITYKEKKAYIPDPILEILEKTICLINGLRYKLTYYALVIDNPDFPPGHLDYAKAEFEKSTSSFDQEIEKLHDDYLSLFRSFLSV